MQDPEFAEIVDLICKEDPRFDRRAYHFLRAGLDFTVREMKKRDPERARRSLHVHGPELLHGLRAYALEQFGPLAYTVLTHWGITKCSHFGELVFRLIEYNVLSKTESDRIEDFADIYDFETAFLKPFEPSRRPAPPAREPEGDPA